MKLSLVLAAALMLLGAPPALAQGYQGKSDDYICNHGDRADPATAEACSRLHGPGATPDAGNTVTGDASALPTTPASAAAPSAPYRQGQSDRQRYEAWQSGLGGDVLAGASWWAAHRSLANPGPCAGAGSASTGPGWSQGCAAAQRQLANSDRLRHSSTDYRQGWNHPSASGEATPETVASATPAQSPVASAPKTPTDVGESPLGTGANTDASAGADNTTDEDNTEVSIDSSHWPWSMVHGLLAMGIIVALIALFSGLAIYFVPTLIAMARHKRNTLAIFALNLFLGWSFIGWVVALIWSLSTEPAPRA